MERSDSCAMASSHLVSRSLAALVGQSFEADQAIDACLPLPGFDTGNVGDNPNWGRT